MFFDVIFFAQHYVCYAGARDDEAPRGELLGDDDADEPSLGLLRA